MKKKCNWKIVVWMVLSIATMIMGISAKRDLD